MTSYSLSFVNRVSRWVGRSHQPGMPRAHPGVAYTAADQIMVAIATLMPPGYRGVYQALKEAR
jgi:hypothetical protein